MTAWKEDAYYLKSADLGANYLPKPVGFRVLQNTLTEIFKKHGFDYRKKVSAGRPESDRWSPKEARARDEMEDGFHG